MEDHAPPRADPHGPDLLFIEPRLLGGDAPAREVLTCWYLPRPLREDAEACSKIRPLSIAGLLAESIRRINNEESVSSLFVD